jgi:hypothetical protein
MYGMSESTRYSSNWDPRPSTTYESDTSRVLLRLLLLESKKDHVSPPQSALHYTRCRSEYQNNPIFYASHISFPFWEQYSFQGERVNWKSNMNWREVCANLWSGQTGWEKYANSQLLFHAFFFCFIPSLAKHTPWLTPFGWLGMLR